MADLEAFRTEAREFLEKNAPKGLRGRGMAMNQEAADEEPGDVREARRQWTKLMADKGWTAPTWPTEYGGGGLSPREARVMQQEMAKLKLPPPLMGMGLSMIGPTLLVHGSEEQKNEYLPKIVTGEHRWCQGFSEPNAGSDLASLSCQAKLDESGDNYIVNGQKIWTSGAQFANWIFLLVRTDETTKHNGITFLLSPMKVPGLEIRPIRLISGNSPFCETFFENVKIPVKNVLGGVNNGWTVAKALLGFERSGMGGIAGGGGGQARRGSAALGGNRMVSLAKETVGVENGKVADGKIREDMTNVMLDQMALTLTQQRSAATAKSKGAPGPETSIFKIVASELGHRRDELMLRLRGTGGLGWEGGDTPEEDLMLTRSWLSAKATTIYGGTSEIQRNIVSKRVLRLPQPK
ncbi:MAG: acyl-CoA dehydrogenase family protein [Myxococcales bacterium]|nr:acyl-CoA dehydrogenase family protein [Myxococcales bacterium]